MRIAVTGASGFCGGVVARAAVAAGAEVVCLGRNPGPAGEQRFWDATRTEPDLSGTGVVLHLAAAVGDPPPGRTAAAAFRAVNVDGTARLLAAAGSRPVVWVSSASVYAAPGPDPITEDHQLAGTTAYGRTKAAGERLALAAGAVVLRPRAVYGPGDPHLLPRLQRVVRAGRALLPGPDVPLSLTAVENLADACLAAAHWPPGAYNIADASPYQRDEVVRAVSGVPVLHLPIPLVSALAAGSTTAARLTGRTPLLSRYALDQLTTGVVLDITRARAQGWTPRRSFADFLMTRAADPYSR